MRALLARLRRDDGFTLIEMLVGITLTLGVLGAVLGVLQTFQRQAKASERQTDAQDRARRALDILSGQVRNAVGQTNGSNAVFARAQGDDIVFLTVDTNPATVSAATNPGGWLWARYCIDAAGRLDRFTKPYVTSSPGVPTLGTCAPAAGWTQNVLIDTIANNATTNPLFTFTRDSPAGPWNPATDQLSDIAALNVSASLDPTPANATRSLVVKLTGGVSLRNLNRPPTAAMACTTPVNGRTSCNASGSTDPDNQPLSYSWQVDGGLPVAGAYSYRFDQALSTGQHTITVTVTDSGGLSSTASATVTA